MAPRNAMYYKHGGSTKKASAFLTLQSLKSIPTSTFLTLQSLKSIPTSTQEYYIYLQ